MLVSPRFFGSVAPVRPALVLLIAVDQFRYDYLPRFRESYESGLKRLLNDGAVFVNANLEHYPSVTAPGHSTMLSGATPKTSGIIGNDWYDRASHRQVTSVSDESVQVLGGQGGIGSSPHRLLVSTLGDEIKRSGSKQSKVIGVSMKDRASILPAGRMADAAYWYDESTGEFVSSTYYFPALPEWARKFNLERQNDRFAGQVWQHSGENATERRLPTETGPKLNAAVYSSSFGNELLELFAERATAAEQLGRRGTTDELTVSFSSNDAVGHTFGPDSPETRTISIKVDQAIGRLLDLVDKQVGLSRVLIIMTSDHGVGPKPEILTEQHMAGGRITDDFLPPSKRRWNRGLDPESGLRRPQARPRT